MTPERAAAVRTALRRVEASVSRLAGPDAEDHVQEALLRAVRCGVEFDAEPWLKVVAKRVAIDRSRRSREVASGGPEDIERIWRTTSPSAEDVALGNDALAAIRRALDAMPARYREALLTYVEAQETTGVARRFGLSTNAAGVLLFRARARLRQELDRVGYAMGIVAGRLQRWEIATCGAAACIAAAAIVSTGVAPSTTPRDKPPAATSERADDGAVVAAGLTATNVSAAPVSTNAGVVAPRPVKNPEVARYEVKRCVPADGDSLPVGVKVTIIDDGRESVIGSAIEELPSELRRQKSGC